MAERKTIDIDHTADGGPVRVSKTVDPRDRVRTAAGILARRIYGPSGCVGALRFDCQTMDGSSATYQAFIGAPAADGTGIAGHNVFLYT